MKPVDPIEGMLIAQIVVANEAALEFYRRGWTNTAAGYLEAGTKYLQLADKLLTCSRPPSSQAWRNMLRFRAFPKVVPPCHCDPGPAPVCLIARSNSATPGL